MRRTRKAENKASNCITIVSKNEEEMIKMAIKKSLEEASESSEDVEFSAIENMKILYPTEEEFKEPIHYIEHLYKEGMWKYGCVKIIPPANFRPPQNFDTEMSIKVPFRTQNLHDLCKNKVNLV